MTSDVVATNSISTDDRGAWVFRLTIVAMLVALADWLFFHRIIGVSFALFMLAIAIAVVLTNRTPASRRELLLATGILVACLLPNVETFSPLSLLIAALGVSIFSLGVTAGLRGDWTYKIVAVTWFALSAPFQFFRDLPVVHAWARKRGVPVNVTLVKGWIVPVVFGVIFVALFAAANPLIENWLSQWRFDDSIRALDMQRLMFWIAATIGVWAFVCLCDRFAIPDSTELQTAVAAELPSLSPASAMFNDRVILRSLLLFNLLFAVQTALDLNYLWRGAALPAGMTYAAYAHRGAYPLILTALLAAAFVLVAMRAGSDAERSPTMRALVYLWVGQNVLLVVSSILRLDLYVEVYLLTYWRVAAFIWMLIVVAGLILIVVRIVTHRSNAWLVAANATVLALMVYACSFVNFPNLVASYNVSRSLAPDTSRPIDLGYVLALGPQAIPALDRYLAARPELNRGYFRDWRDQLVAQHLYQVEDWRGWTFRGWRLRLYLTGFTFNQP